MNPEHTIESALRSYDLTLGPQARQKQAAIDTRSVTHHAVPVTYDDETETVEVGDPVLHPEMEEPVEERWCLASLFPAVQNIEAYTVRANESGAHNHALYRLRQEAMGQDYFYTIMAQAGHDLYGGTGLNQGRFYGIDWANHTMTKAYEPLAYLSLLFTPLARQSDGTPLAFTDLDILVVSDEAMDHAGLPAGYGTALTWQDFGQIRTKVGEQSVAKGVAIGFETASDIGLRIPAHWMEYDLVICESDIKISPVNPGEYHGAFGVTWDNIQTIHGQAISLGYEFWQFLELDDVVLQSLQDIIHTHELPSYEEMVLGLENSRRLAAWNNGNEYQPLELHSKMMEAMTVLGPRYPWLAEQLEKTVFNYLLHWSFPGTEYRLTVVVHDWVSKAYHQTNSTDAEVIAGKYPITAGLMTLAGTGQSTDHFLVLEQSTADQFNIDSDGDCAFTCQGTFFDEILDRDVIKPVRDIDVQGRQKLDAPLTLANQATYGWRIFEHSSDIGSLTIGYYLSEIANDVYGFDVDLSVYFQGIEAVIKSAKWDMDLDQVKYRDRAMERFLKEELSMPYARRKVNQLSKAVNTGAMEIDDALKQSIHNPPHYMEHLWNGILDCAKSEVEALREHVQPLSSFAARIGPVLLPENESAISDELKHVKSLQNLWGELRPGGALDGDAPALAKAVSQAGQVFSDEAVRIAAREYLTYARGRGSFIVHLGYGRLATVFGETTLQYTVSDRPGYAVSRVYSPEIDEADFTLAAQVQLESYVPEVGNTLLLPGEDSPIQDFTGYDLVTALPYLSQRGQFTSSMWLLLQQ